ncbi:MAG TPA: carboxypeptidase regulatory-like domain-containing protein [Vicinamibacterales bacterium]|nr:carboxypeptidase regulatory-like domain-containing protein [Vicinamibacterales bacterium]
MTKKTIEFIVLIGAPVMLAAWPLAPVALAQITTATIVGTITDSTGGALPGATVTARDTDTGFTRSVPAASDGAFRLEFLPIGPYAVEVVLDGFKTAHRGGIVLRVDDTARVDVRLEIGALAETVTVNAAPPLVNTSSAEIGRTVEAAAIAALPLVDRNVYTLLDLTPGVQSNNNGVAAASTGTSSLVLGYPEQRTLINGGADGGTGSVNYYLDGGINMTGLRNTGNILPNPDAIQEFRVQTNSYSVEYGRFASGVVNVVTKSGTNQYRGALFDFVRDGRWNAKDWGSQLDTPPLDRKQFGGGVGGPLQRDKTFFFVSYSGLRQTSNTFLNTAVVPTALERTGDFSASATKPVDPATGQPFACNGVVGVICPNRIDPVATRIINTYIPAANAGNIWQGYVPSPYDSDELLVKIDHQINAAHRFTGSYFVTGGSNTAAAGTGNLPWASQQFNWRQHNVNASDTWVVNSNQINQAWFSYARNFGGRLNLPQTSLGDLGSAFTAQGAPSLPQITVSGYFTLSNAIGGPTAGGDFYSARDVFSWTRGRQAFKLGGELSFNKTVQDTLLNNYGVFTFNNSVTKNALADFMIGIPSAVSQDAPVTAFWNSWYGSAFVQDDFRLSGRVTLNLGLRWDVQTPGTDPLNRFTTYVPGQQSTVNPAAPAGLLFYGDPGVQRGVIKTAWSHVSPRVGLVWDPSGDGRTSVRAAAGVFYGSISGNEWNTMTNFQPWSTRLTFANTSPKTSATGVPLGASLSNPYNAMVGGDPFPYTGKFTAGGGAFGVAQDFRWPRSYQTNVGIERQIARSLSVGAAYVGSFNRDLPFARDVNYPALTPTATSAGANILARRPNPAFGPVLLIESDQTSSYNGLQIMVASRPWHHLDFNGFYTLSKTLSSAQLQNNTTQGLAQNYSNLAEEYGRADTDQRHVFTLSMNWNVDYYRGVNALARNMLNGWNISPIIKLRSGLPFTVTNGSVDANLDGNTNDRAQLIGDPALANPSATLWFNTAAFTQNKAVTGVATDGNSPRNLLDGPAYHSVDLAVSRDFQVTTGLRATVRADATNVFNMVSLGQPGAVVPAAGSTSATFGVIRTANPMRRAQLGVRLTF